MGHSDLISSLSIESTSVLLLTETCYSNSVARSAANGMPCLSGGRRLCGAPPKLVATWAINQLRAQSAEVTGAWGCSCLDIMAFS
jgi:hypothetical protein